MHKTASISLVSTKRGLPTEPEMASKSLSDNARYSSHLSPQPFAEILHSNFLSPIPAQAPFSLHLPGAWLLPPTTDTEKSTDFYVSHPALVKILIQSSDRFPEAMQIPTRKSRHPMQNEKVQTMTTRPLSLLTS